MSKKPVQTDPLNEEIIVRNLWLAKGSIDILRGLDMTIPRGCIYGLLGPSGCGKTSFLRCLVGYNSYDTGTLSIFGTKPGDHTLEIPGRNIGYMPQEIGLYEEMTINEVLTYFGRLFQLSLSVIQTRIKTMIEYLDFNNADQYVRSLSGGQKRRVSFAACLIHKPMLLILDEPTAGVDPLLRKKIWSHLVSLSVNEKITIIITTHYIEESRQATRIGLMRKGRILSEDSPEGIMETHHASTIEDAFLFLCSRRRSTRASLETLNSSKEKKYPRSNTSRFQKSRLIKMYEWFWVFFVLIQKNLLMDLRYPITLFLQIFCPLLQLFLFAICIGSTPFDVKLGIYNGERYSDTLGQEFIKFIDDSVFNKISYTNLTIALDDVKKKNVWAVLAVPEDFTYALIDRTCYNVSNITIADSTITLYADLTDKIVTNLGFKILSNNFITFCKSQLRKVKLPANLNNPFITIQDPIFGQLVQHDYTSFRDFMFPGAIVNLVFSMAIATTALMQIAEKKSQTIERNFVCGITSSQVILSHICSRLFLAIPCLLIMVYSPLYIFNMKYVGDPKLVMVVLITQLTTGIMIGMVIATICNDYTMSMATSAGLLVLNVFISGAVWSLEAIPLSFRWVSYLQSPTLAIEAYRSILFKDYKLTHIKVWLSMVNNLVWCTFCFFIAIRYFYRW